MVNLQLMKGFTVNSFCLVRLHAAAVATCIDNESMGAIDITDYSSFTSQPEEVSTSLGGLSAGSISFMFYNKLWIRNVLIFSCP